MPSPSSEEVWERRRIVARTPAVHTFDDGTGVRGVDIRVCAGEIRALVALNGSGGADWTTCRHLVDYPAGLPRADSGDVSLWPNLTGGEAIDLLSSMHAT